MTMWLVDRLKDLKPEDKVRSELAEVRAQVWGLKSEIKALKRERDSALAELAKLKGGSAA